MKKFLMGVWILINLMTLSWNSAASSNDEGFLRKFASHRSQNRLTTYRAAQSLGQQMRLRPEQVLKRYISASYSRGGAAQTAAVVYGVDAFKESGLSHEMALLKVSDTLGQLTTTLDAIYSQARGQTRTVAKQSPPMARPAGRGLASVKSR